MDTTARLTRRSLLGGGLGLAAGAALGQPAPLRPRARPGAAVPAPLGRPAPPPARAEIADLVREAGLEGRVAVALVDVDSGTLLAAHDAGLALPPASVAKALTALYALDALGADHRFATRVLALGEATDGRLDGDLVLAGGGDPVLTTDRLAELARAVAAAGIREAKGLKAWGGALPFVREVDPGQPDHLGYNPALCGLNLNFNRVHFAWERQGAGYRVTLDARGDAHRPAVEVARLSVEPRSRPVYTYEAQGDVDRWTVARAALGSEGSRWLPVRNPALYAAQAFRGLLAEEGVRVPAPTEAPGLPTVGTEVARIESDPLDALLRDMLLHSTNLTAEVLGLAASRARGLAPATPADSAAAMAAWIREATGARLSLVDHSGLGGESRVAAQEMAIALASRGTMDRLRPLLKAIPLTDAGGDPLPVPPALVRAKTGTLNFASTLAGYARTLAGADLAFAIFAADPDRRAAFARASDDEAPPGGAEWLARARRLQQVLLQRWGTLSA